MRERDRGSRGGARAMPASAMDAARVTRGRSETARALSLGRCAAARRRRCCVRRSRSATTAYLVPVWSIFLLRGPHPRPVAVRGVKTLNETMRLCVFLFGNPGASGALLCEMAWCYRRAVTRPNADAGRGVEIRWVTFRSVTLERR